MLEAYGSALLFIALAILIGHGLAVLTGWRSPWWPGPAVGLAALIVLASLARELPGGSTTAAVVVLLAGLAGAVALFREPRSRLPLSAYAAMAGALVVSAVPFVAQGRVGIPGVSLNNDTSVHMLWAEGLRNERMRELVHEPEGYPLGPHSLMAALAQATGLEMHALIIGLLIALMPLMAVVALGLLGHLRHPVAAGAAVLAAFAYLGAAYWGQGSFKEIAQSLFLLATVVLVRDLRVRGAAEGASAVGWRAIAPLGLLAAGSLLTYSYFGLAWLVGFLGVWAAAELILHRPGRAFVREWGRPIGLGALAVLLVVGLSVSAEIARLLFFVRELGVSPAATQITTENIGNLAGPLSFFEALGLWPAFDYRFPPVDVSFLGALKVLAVLATALAMGWWLWRRDPALPAALIACAAIYLVARDGQSPYVAAKALAIAAPLVGVLVLGALLHLDRGAPRWGLQLPLLAVGVAFALAAAWSSQKALRWTPIESTADRNALEALRKPLAGRTTLFLGDDDYVLYRLRGIAVADLTPQGHSAPIAAPGREAKPWSQGQPLDFDSVPATTLDLFETVVVPRTAYGSQPPPNFRRLAESATYVAYERTGPTPPREVIEGPGNPGRVLDCADPAQRRLSRRKGTATVWREAPRTAAPPGPLGAGQPAGTELALPRGRWRISVSYVSTIPVRVQIGRRRFQLPAYTGRAGSFFEVGEVQVDGRAPTVLTFIAERVSRLTSRHSAALIGGVVASRPGAPEQVPLRQACERYVDFYEPGVGT